MRGADVSALQNRLNEVLDLKNRPGRMKLLKLDGIFGPKTRAAVRLFQRQQDLTANGVAGSKTYAALENPSPLPHNLPLEPLISLEETIVLFLRGGNPSISRIEFEFGADPRVRIDASTYKVIAEKIVTKEIQLAKNYYDAPPGIVVERDDFGIPGLLGLKSIFFDIKNPNHQAQFIRVCTVEYLWQGTLMNTPADDRSNAIGYLAQAFFLEASGTPSEWPDQLLVTSRKIARKMLDQHITIVSDEDVQTLLKAISATPRHAGKKSG